MPNDKKSSSNILPALGLLGGIAAGVVGALYAAGVFSKNKEETPKQNSIKNEPHHSRNETSVISKPKVEEEAVCIICLEEFNSPKSEHFLQCAHKFHIVCILEILNNQNVCPVCRHEISEEEKKVLLKLKEFME